MAQTIEQRAAKYLIDALADVRFNAPAFAHRILDQPSDIQNKFWDVFLCYVYSQSFTYSMGSMNPNLYDVARLSKKIRDFVFSDEYEIESRYPRYGDYELDNLTLFDMT